jgi:adenosylcobinamide-phosphate synthase
LLLVLLLALAIDSAFGEPPVYIHPVVWNGRLAAKLTRPGSGYMYGVLLWASAVLPILVPISLTLHYLKGVALILVASYFLKTSFSIRMLHDLVKEFLDSGQRQYIQQMVRRDVTSVEEEYVNSAAIESLFESTVDGIVSPLFWFALAGIVGALLQRLANTMDSMVGYKTPSLYRLGYFSAKADTVINYLPSRITALVMLAASRLIGFRCSGCLMAGKRASMDSINAKYPIATAACIMGITLEKIGHYRLDYGPLPNSTHVRASLQLFKVTVTIFLTLCITFSLIEDHYLHGSTLFGLLEGLWKLIQ